MTDKINGLILDIIAAFGQSFPEDFRDFVFGKEPDIEWVCALARYYLFEVFKYANDKDDPKFNLRHFLHYESFDNTDRMRYSRVMKYVQKYKDLWCEELLEQDPSDEELLYMAKELRSVPMERIEDRIAGHSITSMNFFEFSNIIDLRLIKATVERRIADSKKISNADFIYAFSEYDQWVEKLKKQFAGNDDDCIFASLAMFTIEWKYSFELIYKIACLMEERKISDIDFNTLVILCGDLSFDSRLGCEISTHSRMVVERQYFLDDLIVQGDIDVFSELGIMRERFAESLALIAIMKVQMQSTDGRLYKDWIVDQVDKHDIAEFFREYDVFCIYEKKELNNQRIRYMRKLYDMILKPKR